jgi:hypothetical protein
MASGGEYYIVPKEHTEDPIWFFKNAVPVFMKEDSREVAGYLFHYEPEWLIKVRSLTKADGSSFFTFVDLGNGQVVMY